ncbi:hypothetical protein C8Q73DRAFT_696057 [Cubamyces lactineus]|nr:hypothetical protein C8Q73DRAFT_696057 [Cubamyces lactineus]
MLGQTLLGYSLRLGCFIISSIGYYSNLCSWATFDVRLVVRITHTYIFWLPSATHKQCSTHVEFML